MKGPNLFIIGAARSGTTSLWHSLKENPVIFMPQDEIYKEPAYFSKKNAWMTPKIYLSLYQKAEPYHKWIGDASTAYLTDPESARRIYEYNPDAKIVIVLRNPAERAYSLYSWMTKEGYEPIEEFGTALGQESYRIKKTIPNWFEPEYYHNYLYYHSGLYYQQVKSYISLFKDNVFIIKFEKLKENYEHTYQDLCSFLQISSNKIAMTEQKQNASVAIKSATEQFLVRKIIKRILNNKKLLAEIVSDDKKKIHQFLFEESKKDLSKLNQYLRICCYRRYIIQRKLKKLTYLSVTALNRIVNHKTKGERDFLLKSGFQKITIQPLRQKPRQNLIQQYEQDIQMLSKLVSSSFLEWLDP